MRKRSLGIFVLLLTLLSGLMLHIYQLSGNSLRQAAEQQAGLTLAVANARGTIYDCQLRPLVNAKTELRAAVSPTAKALSSLSGILDGSALDTLAEKLAKGRPIVTTLSSQPALSSGLLIFSTPVRYQEAQLAPHVVGYLDGDGLHGVTGAEQAFDKQLSAGSGKLAVTYTVDATGTPLEGESPAVTDTLGKAKAGVALTIDADIQKIAEEISREMLDKGAVVVMEPSTGRIAALVSRPDFQLSSLAESLNNPDSPLINRALSNYNCGSVFKIVTAAAALEAGIPTSTAFACNGSATIGNVTFHCHNRLGHGTLTMAQGFAESCNPYFIQLAQRIGGTRLYQMAVSLGFDKPVILAESWKTSRAALPSETELLSPAAVGNLAFGQGSLMATPLHIAQLVGAVVNQGNLVRPTLLLGTVDENGTLAEEPSSPPQTVFSKATASTLKSMMIQTVEEGTGTAAKPAEWGAGGKTGTAETGVITDGRAVVQGWFAGFYPAEEPRYVMVVLAEDTGKSGVKPTLIFRRLCEELNILRLSREKAGGVSSAG